MMSEGAHGNSRRSLSVLASARYDFLHNTKIVRED
jgi:hypothetical protein